MKSLVSIAGFDASSGAGVVRDVDTFFSFGFHGIAVPTCTVVQGPGGVKRVEASSEGLFRDVLRAATTGIAVKGVKIGVLCDESHVRATAGFLARRRGVPVVLDPVFAAKNGVPLITDEARAACIDVLFEKVTVITPNAEEASAITGVKVRTVKAARKAAEKLRSLGPGAVIVKGGHLEGDPVDILFDGREYLLYRKTRFPRLIHGTGCSFSSALACFLAAGYPLTDAFVATQRYLERLFESSYRIDRKGYFYVSSATEAASDTAGECMKIQGAHGRLPQDPGPLRIWR
ncbi:MAG: Hydroxymethylpyrimidine/phosphomethylpyrimidine kinase [Syntrophorhabdus sp. PtaB.Bin047]|jgi:hydroxymethylpyrimidine/phosphomethylpyrimidine kinase|nr:MAG: Hydroxymethylpyrimidine/phosphomethylpyrimidine kinase [Syntrophorhabdus sp. PtaB.Bin047]